MFLSNGNDYIEIKVAGYEFPDRISNGSDFDYDANWLNLYCNKRIDGIRKYGVFPCILTQDIVRFINLITDYQNEKIDKIEFGGIEPNFAFYLTRENQEHLLEIFFYLEDTGEKFNDVKNFVKNINSDEIEYIKKCLNNFILEFPVR